MKHGALLKKIFRYLVVAGVIALFSFFIFGKGLFDLRDDLDNDERVPSPSPSAQQENAVELQVTRMISRKDNVKYWQLLADKIKVNQETRKGDATVINCTFFDDRGEPYISLKASGADIDMNTQSLDFRGRVNASMADGGTMEVEKLVWDGKKKRLFGYKSVKLTRKDAVLTGNRMVGDPARKYVEILGNVDVVWRNVKPGSSSE